MFDLKNLDDVERYIKKNMPDWEMKRGQLDDSRALDGNDYEVIKLYSPETGQVIAEFWRGYYGDPNRYTGIYKAVCIGDLNFAMNLV